MGGVLEDLVDADCPHVRQEVKERVAGQSADGQPDQELDDVAVVVALDHRYEGDAQEADPTDGQHRPAGEEPAFHQLTTFIDFSVGV